MKVVYLSVVMGLVMQTCLADPKLYTSDDDLTSSCAIDQLVFNRLRKKGIKPAKLCSDSVFLRRVYLDVIGTLPKVKEARAFLDSRDSDKRARLIDKLLERDEFIDYWSLKWCDMLRVKAEFPINLWPNAVQAYYRWVHTAIRDNMPYDQFARELLTSSGSNFRVPPVNFYRAVQGKNPESLAKTTALTFMGLRSKYMNENQIHGLSAFFSYVGYKRSAEWKEEIVYFDAIKAQSLGTNSVIGTLPDGKRIRLNPECDPRRQFADWLLATNNPWFARNVVNRIWYWLHGQGIIHEPDDIRPDNPPRQPELLDWLEKELVKSHYDLKHIYRVILNSKVYQLSCIPRSTHPEAGAYLAYYPMRRLDAEVLIDALCQLTDTTESYSSAIPEPFTFIPEHHRSITLADGSISSSFLEMFGRPPRDTGMLSERNNNPTPAQRLHLLNSSHVQKKLRQSNAIRQLQKSNTPREAIDALYLAVLSRLPTDEERNVLRDFFIASGFDVNAAKQNQRKMYAQRGRFAQRGQKSGNATVLRDAVTDIAWALINSAEFLYKH